MPKAENAAHRSSTITVGFSFLLRATAIINGAFLEPGDKTTFFILCSTKSSARMLHDFFAVVGINLELLVYKWY
jgi:hypothetical protein